jgi:flagellar basal-body rod modification protein FlgD
MATSLNPISASNAATPSTQSAAASADLSLTPDKQTFLELLVAQIKNQDPLNPTDGSQFVAQLAQFSELEQTMGIAADLKAIKEAVLPSIENNG